MVSGGLVTAGAGHAEGPSRRIVILFQMLLAGVIVLAAALLLLFGMVDHPTFLLVALALVFCTCSAVVLAPGQRWAPTASAVLVGANVVTIGVFRLANPELDLGMLWVFPLLWVAWFHTLAATVTALGVVFAGYLSVDATSGVDPTPTRTVLFPLGVAALTVLGNVVARRGAAQRGLLGRQALALQQAVDRSQRQENLVTAVLDTVDFDVVVFAADGSTSVVNRAHDRFGQIRAAAGEAVYLHDGITQADRRHTPMARARRGEVFAGELHWYGAPGESRRALYSTARRLPGRREDAVVVVTQDVTEVELAVRDREDLIASVSHELRTPLTSILGYVELAADAPELAERTRRNLEVAERNAERLLELIADILAASAQGGVGIAVRIDPTPDDLTAVIHAAVEAAAGPARGRQIHIDTEAVEPTWARIDAQRVRQVMDNLISNAIKYGREGGLIEVGCTSDGTHAWVVVRDDGPGIAAHEIPHVFDRFFRSSRVRNTAVHGSGLGLAISRDFVRAHGGDLMVTSEPGRGSTFVMRLPAVPAQESAGAPASQAPRRHGETTQQAGTDYSLPASGQHTSGGRINQEDP